MSPVFCRTNRSLMAQSGVQSGGHKKRIQTIDPMNYYSGEPDEIFDAVQKRSPRTLSQGINRKILVHNEDLMMVEVSFEKGAIAALHSHPHQQMSYILSGAFDFENAGGKESSRTGGLCPDRQ